MIDASTVKDFLTPKTFSIIAYVWLIFKSLLGVLLSSIVVALRADEFGKFNCAVATESTAVKTDVEKRCYNEYEQTYNSPLPFYIFVLLSIWLPVSVAVIYSLAVRKRVEEIVSRREAQSDDEADNTEQNRNTSYVFYGYLVHFLVRLLFGVVFTVLQYTVFFPNDFDFEFGCSRRTTKVTSKITNNQNVSQLNGTSITCENSSAREKDLCGVFVCALNSVDAVMILVELITLFWRFPSFKSENGRICDTEFVIAYLLPKRYTRVNQIELTNVECINVYRQQVLELPRTTDISYGPNAGLDDLFVQVVIHTGRAPHHFRENMDREEIFKVYRNVPKDSILLKSIKDLFHPKKDTNGTIPRKILVIGRPGIGKTVLTRKILRDWGNGKDDEYYRDKIAFYFKFHWMNCDEFKNLTLKTFLCITSRLSEETFERIYEDITNEPKKALLIFDGLDEFPGDLKKCFRQPPSRDDPNTCMSGISIFIKLIQNELLKGATVVVTSRPTASDDFRSQFKFDRKVEILGFTPEKIEEYVGKFCDNQSKGDRLKSKIWNHIKSSSDLVNLSYIPVNCFIVSVTLFECYSDNNETGTVPRTITELYQGAINHFDKFHKRKVDGETSKKAIKELQLLAYNGIENGELVFSEELIDKEMKQSGLLNSLSNPIFPVETKYCFIHLTIQEFLAAKHVIETKALEEIKPFISCRIDKDKWHLVLQFIAGLLGKKMKMSSEKQRYKDCVSAFISKGFVINCGELELSYRSTFVMKCLKEVGDEDVAREACEKTALKDVVSLNDIRSDALFLSDWAAVVFVCKYMKELKDLTLILFTGSEECFLEVYKFVQQRCIRALSLAALSKKTRVEPVLRALMATKCTLNHDQHSKLTKLTLFSFCITDKCSSTMCEFLKNGHGSFLEELKLFSLSRMFSCQFLDFVNLCPQLKVLWLEGAGIRDEGVRVLYNALIGHEKLKVLCLHECSLTDDCMGPLCELLTDRHCNLDKLSLFANQISDEGVRIFCEHVLSKQHCKLTRLELNHCLLTSKCIPLLCKLLNDKCCKLTVLHLGGNVGIADEGVRVLCKNSLTKEHCNLRELSLSVCSLTDECIPELRKTLLDEHCVLNKLLLLYNRFTTEGKELLRKDRKVDI